MSLSPFIDFWPIFLFFCLRIYALFHFSFFSIFADCQSLNKSVYSSPDFTLCLTLMLNPPPSLYPILKGQCHQIFCFRFCSWIIFPQAPENNIRVLSIFFENSRRYSQVKVHHRYQRHRWHIMGTIAGCLHLKMNLNKNIYLYVNSATHRCPNKTIKTFLIGDFFHLPPVSTKPVVHLELRISHWIFEKKLNCTIGMLRGLGETVSRKKTWIRKSRGTVPLKV